MNSAVDDEELTVAIVGMGPRGLSVLERLLVRLADQPPDRPVHVWVLDPGEPGAGRIWRTSQPEWFAMNTPAGEVTMYSGDPDDGPVRPGAGPSLHQWLAGHSDPSLAGTGPSDYATRAVYGQYLTSVYRSLTADLPPRVAVTPVRALVTRVQRQDNAYLVFLDQEPRVLSADKIVLTTGHPHNRPGPVDQEFLNFAGRRANLRYLRAESAADQDLDSIRSGDTVGIVGLGLSCYDIVLALTEGRGGRFEPDGTGGLRYVASGAEPRIVAGSRSGLPMPARGHNQKPPKHRYQPVFLTEEAITAARDRLVAERGSAQLDFREDVLPLMRQEINHVYYTTHLRHQRGEEVAGRFARANQLVAGLHPVDAEKFQAELIREFELTDLPPVDLVELARPFRGAHFQSQDEFHKQLLELLRQDVAQARLGNVDGPLKAALDIMRDLRSVVRFAVEFSGLRPSSHRDFLTWFNPINAMLSAGPPAFRVAQLCALVEHGTVTVTGPDTQFGTDADAGRFVVWSPRVHESRWLATVLIDGRIPRPDLASDDSPLTRQLLADGMISEYVNTDPVDGETFRTGGMAITPAPFHVIDAFGRPNPDIYALGIPTEHTRWFTQIGNGRPGATRGFHGDADAIAADVLTGEPTPRRPASSDVVPARRRRRAPAPRLPRARTGDPLST